MKTIYLVILLLLVNFSFTCAQNSYSKTYKFGLFSVETGKTARNITIKVQKGKQTLFCDSSSQGIGYTKVDTLSINSDGLQDFVYSYLTDQFVVTGVLASDPATATYRNIDIVFGFLPAKASFKLESGDTIKPFTIKDVDGDGKRDVVTTVLMRNGIAYPVKKFSDTIGYTKLKRRAEGKLSNVKFNGVYYDKGKFYEE